MEHPSSMIDEAIRLLSQMISIPSVSRSEDGTADLLAGWLQSRGVEVRRVKNNVWALAPGYDPKRPTLMLNSHHDTVKPSPAYTNDPFTPSLVDGRLYGLGSNDAGASVVSLMCTFVDLCNKDLGYNLMLALSAEEEVSGENGMRALLPELNRLGIKVDAAIVGEPTGMQPAIAERGLLVLDCTAHGVSGHAARNEGVNALYKAVDDINRIRSYRFPKASPTLGDIKMSVTMISAGQQHNVVPAECKYVVDVRTTDAYTNEETEGLIAQLVDSDVKARSYRIRASVISESHPLVRAAVALGGNPFVSPTTSDMALMAFPTLKIGPGQSSRSHTADEYVEVAEIADALTSYKSILQNIKLI